MRKKLTAMGLGLMVAVCTPAMAVHADSSKVVTIGANLSDEQKTKIFEYFGVQESSVEVLTVTNKEEREYLEGVASEAKIGKRTYSCAYIEPTEKGKGINVKTANINWVTPYMIKSTLTTAGIYDCNVLAAAPFEVSGTGALTGIMKAFESVTGEKLDEEKKELATEELVMTGDLADQVGSEQATGIITEVKDNIIGQNIIQADKIDQVIIDASKNYNVTLTDDQVKMIARTMTKVANQDYDYDRLSDTFKSIKDSTAEKLGIDLKSESEGIFEAIKEFFANLFNWIKSLFVSEDADSEDLGILGESNDSALGDNVIIDSTENATPMPEATATPSATPEAKETAVPSATPTVKPTKEPEMAATTEPTKEPVKEDANQGSDVPAEQSSIN